MCRTVYAVAALAGAALLTPVSSAHAVGVGTSVGVLATEVGGFSPSLDLHFDPFVVQIHAMEFLSELSENDFRLGANMWIEVYEAQLTKTLDAVVEPGVGVDLFVDPTAVFVEGGCRLGIELDGNKGGFGVYGVPAIGLRFDNNDGNNLFFAGGAVQMSVWFGN